MKCRYCGKDQLSGLYKKHALVCKKNPANNEPPSGYIDPTIWNTLQALKSKY